MTFTEAVKTCFRKFFTFSGRASRSEYWWFSLFCLLGGFTASFAESSINAFFGDPTGPTMLSGAFNLATFIPGLSAGWRRMHDTGRSGLYLFYPFVVIFGVSTFAAWTGAFDVLATNPEGALEALNSVTLAILAISMIVLIISPFLVLYWLTRPSQPGPNAYGPNPHEVSP
ncbi:DUF805 domain-containing protein [Roseobacter sp.]|uniref:DUF805 domain-containing protein n=1 Tax=Roseobacter sp. TaxID=1907202 RepID=UPI003859A869